MEAKIRNGGTHYDVAFPSEYTVQKLKRENLLEPLDHSKVPNIKNLDPNYMNMPYDRNNKYSLPYFFGTVGILYIINKPIQMKTLVGAYFYTNPNIKMMSY